MSVHDKKKIQEHIHFEDEILEAKSIRPLRPPYKKVHGTDLVIDGEITLAETIVAWSRGWVAEQLVNVDPACVLQDNPEASHGKYLKLPYDAAPILEPFDTPEILGDIGGEFYAIFAMKVDNNASSSTLCRLRVRANGVTRGYYDLKPSDFPASNVLHHFAVRGRFKGNDTNKHIDIYDFKAITGAHLHVDYIGIVPTSVPMGYADVTVQTEYPAGIAETVDPAAYGDWVDPAAWGSEVDPNASGDLVDPAASAASGSSSQAVLLNQTAYGSYITVSTTNWTTIRSGTCSVNDAGTLLSYIETWVNFDPTSSAAYVMLRIMIGSKSYFYTSWYFAPNNFSLMKQTILLSANISGQTITVQALSTVANCKLRARIYYANLFLKHSHAIVGDSHTTPIIDDAHSTPIVDDAHSTPIVDDAHPHPIEGDEHDHPSTEDGHEH